MSRAKVHLVLNQKGGVGKTTIVMNLAAVTQQALETRWKTAGEQRRYVLVASIDPQGSSVWWGNRSELPFDYIQITEPGQLRELAETGGYRHIFIDTPGSWEDEKYLEEALDEADDAVVPLVPEPLAFDPTTRTIVEVLQPRGLPYRVVVNRWDTRDGISDLRQTAEFIVAQGWPMAENVIRQYKLHTRASAEGRVCTQYEKNRTAMEASTDFLRLALELGYGGKVS